MGIVWDYTLKFTEFEPGLDMRSWLPKCFLHW